MCVLAVVASYAAIVATLALRGLRLPRPAGEVAQRGGARAIARFDRARAALSWLAAMAGRVLIWEVLAIVGLTSLAAYLRFYDLTEFPFGLRGDEASVGILAHQISDVGWIGPYTLSQAGFPLGPVYFYARVIDALGEGIFSLRAGPALLGTAAVPAMYLAARQFASARVAFCAALLLAVSHWHIALSRLAFPVIAWPLMEIVSIGFLAAGMRTRQWPYYLAAGMAAGFCWHSYQAGWLFLVALGVFFVLRLIAPKDASRLREVLLWGILGGGALLASWSMIDYARDPKNDFGTHRELVSVTNTTAYKEAASRSEKIRFWYEREEHYVRQLTWESVPEAATGIGVKPPIDGIALVLICFGALIALWRWRQSAYLLAIVMLPVMSLGAVLTVGEAYRRSFGILPALILLAGVGLGTLWEFTDRLRPARRAAALAVIVAMSATIVYDQIDLQFDSYRNASEIRNVFSPELTYAAAEMAQLPDQTQWYLVTSRAPGNQEIFVFFLGENLSHRTGRSREFGTYSLDIDDTQGPVGFAFLDLYLQDLPRVAARYPGGRVLERSDRYGYLYRIYYLPPGPVRKSQETSVAPVDLTPADGTLALPDGASAPTQVSCVASDQARSFAFYRYSPTFDTYASFRRMDNNPSGDIMAVWLSDGNSVSESGCIATRAFGIPERPLETPEIGFEASGRGVYYVGVALDGSGVVPAIVVHESSRRPNEAN